MVVLRYCNGGHTTCPSLVVVVVMVVVAAVVAVVVVSVQPNKVPLLSGTVHVDAGNVCILWVDDQAHTGRLEAMAVVVVVVVGGRMGGRRRRGCGADSES